MPVGPATRTGKIGKKIVSGEPEMYPEIAPPLENYTEYDPHCEK